MNRVTDMTTGSPIRLIFFFSLPLMLGSIFQQFYTIADTIIVSRGVGIDALASLGASDWINWMVLWGCQGLTQGLSVPVAQEFGAKNYCALRKTVAMLVKLCLVIGIVLTIGSLLAVTPLLRLLGTDPDILPGAQTYLHTLFAGVLVVIAYNMAAGILRCLGDSRTPLLALIIASFTNIGLDLLFVFVFHWGIFGAAFATVIAQFCSFLFCLHVLRRMPLLQMEPEDWQTDYAVIRHLCRMGLPVGLQNAIISVGGMVVQSVLNGFGIIFVAGFTATNKLYGLLECTAIAFGHAMTTYIGQNTGARRMDRIDAGLRADLLLSFLFSSVIGLSMLSFGRSILQLFISSTEESAAEVMAVAYRYLTVMSIPLFILFLIHVYRPVLQGLGNTTVPMLSGVAEVVGRIISALILPRFLGQDGIFYAEVVAWTCAVVLMVVYYYANIGKIRRRIEALPHNE